MKLGKLSLALFAAVAIIVGCKKENEDLGTPNVSLNSATMDFEQASASKTLELTATRDWRAVFDADWFVIEPKSGNGSAKAQTITVTVLENKGADRTASVKFDIGFAAKTLTVNQKGTGSAADAVVYYNDFDKEQASKNNNKWPFLDQFEGWKNAKGNGNSTVEYDFKSASARTNKYHSASDVSDYKGSGMNYLWFGKEGYFQVKTITLPATRDFVLSFGAERNEYDPDKPNVDNTFKPAEFPVYISNDGAKWVALEYTFPNGFKNKRWDLATAKFTLPAGVDKLYICVKPAVPSVYAFDDLKLEIATESGTAVDFSKGIDLGLGGGGTVTPPTPGDVKTVTVAEFLAAPESNSQPYKLTGIVTGHLNAEYGNFDLKDATGQVYCYGLTATNLGYGVKNDKSFATLGIEVGDEVTLIGYRGSYNGKDEILYAYHVSHKKGSTPEPGETVTGTLAQLAAAADNSTVKTNEVLVVAKAKNALLLQEGTDYIMVYNTADGAVGDKVVVSGTKSTYNNFAQVGSKDASPTVEVKSSGNAVNHPAAKSLDGAALDAYSSNKVEFVSYTGTLTISGHYYNVAVAGATKNKGSLVAPLETIVPASANGKTVEVEGYYVYTAGGKYVSMIVVKATVSGGASVDPTKPTDPTDLAAQLKSNVTWTLGANSYSENATVNGSEQISVLKLGTGKKQGSAEILLKKGTKKVNYFAIAWSKDATTLVFKVGDNVVGEQALQANSTLYGNQPYTLTIEDPAKSRYKIELPSALENDTNVTVTTKDGAKYRAVLFGIQAE